MKYRIAALMLLLLACLCGAALAEGDAPQVSMVIPQMEFTGPQEITVSILVANTGVTDMPGPCALYDPNGQRIEAFGTPTLLAGRSVTWTGKCQVTDEMLDSGRLTFALIYFTTDSSGAIISKTQPFYTTIERIEAEQPAQTDDIGPVAGPIVELTAAPTQVYPQWMVLLLMAALLTL